MTKNQASNVSVVENSETSSLMHCDFASDYVCYVILMHCDFASDYVCYVSIVHCDFASDYVCYQEMFLMLKRFNNSPKFLCKLRENNKTMLTYTQICP